jgi:hypothetical protein
MTVSFGLRTLDGRISCVEEFNEAYVSFFVAHPEQTITQTETINREKLVTQLQLRI